MRLQIDIVGANSAKAHGFYRIMYELPTDVLPSYWMYNGTWHHRRYPDLNPPDAWRL